MACTDDTMAAHDFEMEKKVDGQIEDSMQVRDTIIENLREPSDYEKENLGRLGDDVKANGDHTVPRPQEPNSVNDKEIFDKMADDVKATPCQGTRSRSTRESAPSPMTGRASGRIRFNRGSSGTRFGQETTHVPTRETMIVLARETKNVPTRETTYMMTQEMTHVTPAGGTPG